MKNRYWLFYALTTTLFWGIWGAIIEIPEKGGFPATLGYAVWALTMIPPMLVALKNIDWQLERNSPAYLLFPIISLSPVVTILLS